MSINSLLVQSCVDITNSLLVQSVDITISRNNDVIWEALRISLVE